MIRGGRRRSQPPLQRMFGEFKCPCHSDAKWSSAHVYCVKGTFKVYFKQECSRCGVARTPYHVDYLQCSMCGKKTPDCVCGYDNDGGGENRSPHRADLCMKCKSGLPCASTLCGR
ncbi:Zygote arrest protein 1 [Mactra antiquata]